MWRRKYKMSGQATLEYAMLVAVIAAAAWGIQNYLRRGIHGRIRTSTDQIGSQWDAGASTYVARTTFNSQTRETLDNTGVNNSELLQDTVQTTEREEDVTSLVTGALP